MGGKCCKCQRKSQTLNAEGVCLQCVYLEMGNRILKFEAGDRTVKKKAYNRKIYPIDKKISQTIIDQINGKFPADSESEF